MRGAGSRRVGLICDACAPSRVAAQAPRPRFSGTILGSSSRRPCQLFPPKPSRERWTSTAAAAAPIEPKPVTATPQASLAPHQTIEPQELAKIAEDSRAKFMAVDGIPAPGLTKTALQTCLRAAATLHPQLKRAEVESRASASRLVALGAERSGAKLPIEGKIQDAVNRISHSAYIIIANPNVEMTPEVLELYVQIQAQLGRPESLPSVLEMYASKPKPVVKDGKIQYLGQNPKAAMRAIEVETANLALGTAINARHLDSALGIVEASFRAPAFRRQKLLKHTTAPAIGVASLPFGIYGLSSAYAAYCQNTMDISTATGVGVAGISCYFLAVGSLGLIAKLSHKDEMKRVTWTPGTPLRYRWLRAEERTAMDRIACAWGFKEPWRHGEESGPEWEGLKEYMGYRQMLLDRVEFAQGMN